MAQKARKVGEKCRRMGLREDEAPPEIDRKSEQIIKELVLKQTNTQTSLAEQLSSQKQFVGSSQVTRLAEFPAGPSSLDQFAAQAQLIDLSEKLRRIGCNSEDIKMTLDFLEGEAIFRQKYKLLESIALTRKIEEIKLNIKALENYELESSDSAVANIGRHTKELLQSVAIQSDNSKIVHFVQKNQAVERSVSYPADHPMTHIVELEQQLFGHLKPTEPEKKRKKKRMVHKGTTSLSPDKSTEISCAEHREAMSIIGNEEYANISTRQQGSLWDKKERPVHNVTMLPKSKTPATDGCRVYTCSPQTWYTLKDNKPQFLGSKLSPTPPPKPDPKPTAGTAFVAPIASYLVPLEDIQSQRITQDEILQLKHITDYEPGVPSATLYLKNLANSVSESDLVSIFAHFENPDSSQSRMVYRLMRGRMKGQAFLTFSSIHLAQQAMNSVNGYKLKGKPIIIQFGKK